MFHILGARLQGWSIQRTIFAALLAMVLVVAYILTGVAFRLYSEILLEKTMQGKRQTVELAASNLNSIMNHVDSLSRLAVLNVTLQQLIGNDRLKPYERHSYGYVLKEDFNYMIESNRELTAIIAYLGNGQVYASSSVNAMAYAKDPPVPHKSANLGYTSALRMVDTHPVLYLANRPSTDVVSVYRPLISYLTTDIHGLLQFDILERQLASVLTGAGSEDGTSLCIVDGRGRVVSSPDKGKLYGAPDQGEIRRAYERVGGVVYRLRGKEYFRLERPMPAYGWTIVADVPTDALMRENRAAASAMYGIVALCMALMLLPIWALSRAISRPLKQLALAMRRAGEGDFGARVDERYGGEVGQLSRVFNKMLGRIAELLRQGEREQQQKRKFEFLAMQAQIKPHFLYNTLDNVCAMILLGHAKQAYTMGKALAQFYRRSLSGGRAMVPLSQEMEIVRNYLVIQEIRFKDRFRYSIECPDSLADALVPKLIVQPLVENALSHGIRNLEGPGEIRVYCGAADEYVVLSVRDNGEGFSPESLLAMEQETGQEQADKGFGLDSVIQRLRYYYDPQCKLRVVNHPEGGCTVSISLRKELNANVPVDDRG